MITISTTGKTYTITQKDKQITLTENELIELYYDINEIILNNEKLWNKKE